MERDALPPAVAPDVDLCKPPVIFHEVREWRGRMSGSLGSARVNHVLYLGDTVGWKAALPGVLPYGFYVRSQVNAIYLVVGHEAFDPLDLRPQLTQHSARLLRNRLQLFPCQLSCTGNLPFDDILWHASSPPLCRSILSCVCPESKKGGHNARPCKTKRPDKILGRFVQFNPGNDRLSHAVTRAVPWALEGLTTVFGMGTGVTPPV